MSSRSDFASFQGQRGKKKLERVVIGFMAHWEMNGLVKVCGESREMAVFVHEPSEVFREFVVLSHAV